MDTNDQNDEARISNDPPSMVAATYGAAANEKCRMTINRFREVLGMRARPRVALGSAGPIEGGAKTHRTPKVLRAKRGRTSPRRRAGGHVNDEGMTKQIQTRN